MRADAYPVQMLLLTVSGWVNRHQQDLIAYRPTARSIVPSR